MFQLSLVLRFLSIKNLLRILKFGSLQSPSLDVTYAPKDLDLDVTRETLLDDELHLSDSDVEGDMITKEIFEKISNPCLEKENDQGTQHANNVQGDIKNDQERYSNF